MRTVRFIKDHGLISMALFGCMIASLVFLFRVVPGGLVPNEDQGYILGMTILDDGAVQNRTRDVTRVVMDVLRKDPSVDTVMTLNGLDITSMSSKSNYGTFFAVLKPWSERTTPESSASAISTKVLGVTMMQPEAVTIGFTPPPISGMSTTGGFEGFIQMRGAGTSQDLEATANAFVAEATSRDENGQPKYPAIGTLRSLFSTGAPQLYANLDRERCKDMGISISDVFTAMNATFGALYVNDFNYLGRTFQVRMQAEADYRLLPESLHDIFVRTNKGGMVPLDAIMTLERRTAPQTMERYDVFPAAHLMGEPAPGYSSGQALEAMEKVAEKMLSSDYGLGWVGSALQEKLASADTTVIFVLALVMVFLILAAQYARERGIPYLGICLGMQIAVIEFARHVLSWDDATSAEFSSTTAHPVIALMPEQVGVTAKGGTMRLGKYPCVLEEGSLSRALYDASEIWERHRHRYEFNNDFRDDFTDAGMRLAGLSPDGTLVEIVESKSHPWFVGAQFHPEFKSRPNKPHPLFRGFVAASLDRAVH